MRNVNLFVTYTLTAVALCGWCMIVRQWYLSGPWGTPLAYWSLAISFSVFACVGWALVNTDRRWQAGRPVSDRETRCRKCGYILRGLSEPRCPECGETI